MIESQSSSSSRRQKVEKENSESANSNAEPDQSPRLKKNDFAIAFVEAIVGGSGFSLLGEYFESIGFHSLKKWCVLLALIAVEFALAHLVFKAAGKKRIVWTIYGIVTLLEFAALAIVAGIPDSKPLPSFTFKLRTGAAPNAEVSLTNNFLMFTNFGKEGPLPDILGSLIVPVPVGSPLLLRLVVKNDTSAIAKNGDIVVSFPKVWECDPPAEWDDLKSVLVVHEQPEARGLMQMRALGIKFRYALLPSDEYAPPPIPITKVPDFDKAMFGHGLISIIARAENFQTSSVMFNVLFYPTPTNVPKPFIKSGITDSNGVVRFQISSEDFEELKK